MTSREIVIRTIEFTGPSRVAYGFLPPHSSDLHMGGAAPTQLVRPARLVHRKG